MLLGWLSSGPRIRTDRKSSDGSDTGGVKSILSCLLVNFVTHVQLMTPKIILFVPPLCSPAMIHGMSLRKTKPSIHGRTSSNLHFLNTVTLPRSFQSQTLNFGFVKLRRTKMLMKVRLKSSIPPQPKLRELKPMILGTTVPTVSRLGGTKVLASLCTSHRSCGNRCR